VQSAPSTAARSRSRCCAAFLGGSSFKLQGPSSIRTYSRLLARMRCRASLRPRRSDSSALLSIWLKRTYDVPLSFRLGESDGCYDHPEECTEVGNRFLVLVTEGALEPGHSHDSSTEAHIRGPHVLPEVSIKNLLHPNFEIVVACQQSCLPIKARSHVAGVVPFSSRMTEHICGCICSRPYTTTMGRYRNHWHHADGLRLTERLPQEHDRSFHLGIGQGYQVSEAILRPIERPAHPTPFYLQL